MRIFTRLSHLHIKRDMLPRSPENILMWVPLSLPYTHTKNIVSLHTPLVSPTFRHVSLPTFHFSPQVPAVEIFFTSLCFPTLKRPSCPSFCLETINNPIYPQALCYQIQNVPKHFYLKEKLYNIYKIK